MTMTMTRCRGRGRSRSRNLSGAVAGAGNFKNGRLRQPWLNVTQSYFVRSSCKCIQRNFQASVSRNICGHASLHTHCTLTLRVSHVGLSRTDRHVGCYVVDPYPYWIPIIGFVDPDPYINSQFRDSID